MTDPAFDLAQLEHRPTWYDHLPQVEAAMAEEDRIHRLRWQAGWTADEGGWFSPEGISAADWEHEYGYPLPEDPAFLEWASAFYHYDALDNDLDPDALWPTTTNPAPPASPPTASPRVEQRRPS